MKLSAHLICDLHAEVLSWLMIPSTLKDPPTSDSSTAASSLIMQSMLDALRLRPTQRISCAVCSKVGVKHMAQGVAKSRRPHTAHSDFGDNPLHRRAGCR